MGRFDPFTIKWPKHMDGSNLLGKNVECDENGEIIIVEAEIPMGNAVNCIPSFDLNESGFVLFEDAALTDLNTESFNIVYSKHPRIHITYFRLEFYPQSRLKDYWS